MQDQSKTDRKTILNNILLNIPPRERDAVLAKSEFVRLKPYQILHEAGEALKSAYFCNSGTYSIVTVMPDGKSVDVGVVGTEGFLGVPLIAGFRTSNARVVVQVGGSAFRVEALSFRAMLRQSPGLEWRLRQYMQYMTLQLMQTAACNCLHSIEQRLAKWVLMLLDRTEDNSLPITQESFARMLGTRRPSVTIAAGKLEEAALIASARGRITVLDKRGLEAAACPCYVALRTQTRRWEAQRE